MLREKHHEGSLLINGAQYCRAVPEEGTAIKHIVFAFCNTTNTNLRWQFCLCMVACDCVQMKSQHLGDKDMRVPSVKLAWANKQELV